MRLVPYPLASLLTASLFTLSACSVEESAAPPAEETKPTTESLSAGTAFPASLPVVGDGYPARGAPCRRLGESAATVDWLDDSAVLVGCPSREDARALGGKLVGVIEGITLVSVPMGDANVGMAEAAPMQAPVKSTKAAAPKDFIRGKGGLEEKCHARLAREVGARVICSPSAPMAQI